MTATTRPGYEWWDRLCALPKYSFVLGPAGDSVRRVEDKVGNWIEYPYAQAVVDDAQAEINQLRQIISDCAAALGKGTGMSTDCSLDFMRLLPDEIRAAVTPPAASGAAPALPKAVAHILVGDDSEDVFTADQMRDYALAALASREAAQPASPAPLTDDVEHTARTAASYQYADHADPAYDAFNAARVAFLKGADWQKSWAVLASPQVAPAPGLSVAQEPKYTVSGSSIVNRQTGEAIPEDEPVFVFRARDALGVRALTAYLDLIGEREPASAHADAVRRRIADFQGFAAAHPERMKWPDTGLAAPVQVAPAAEPPMASESIRRLLESCRRWHNGSDWRSSNIPQRVLAWEGHREVLDEAIAAPTQSGAAADDARDAARLDFLIENEGRVTASRTYVDPTLKYQCWGPNEDDDYRYLSGEHEYFNTPREAIDAAMALSTPAAKPADPAEESQA